MAKQKCEFVSALGIAFEFIKALAEEVYALGGTDDHIRRALRERQLLRDFAKTLVVPTGVGEVYEQDVDYDDPCWKTIDRERYAYVGDVKPSDYPETETGKKSVRFREIWFDHDPTDDEVLECMTAINCRQPSRAEVETVIREKYSSEELGRNPRIGLIGSAVGRSGGLHRAYVNGLGGGVELSWDWTDVRWDRDCRFVVVCK